MTYNGLIIKELFSDMSNADSSDRSWNLQQKDSDLFSARDSTVNNNNAILYSKKNNILNNIVQWTNPTIPTDLVGVTYNQLLNNSDYTISTQIIVGIKSGIQDPLISDQNNPAKLKLNILPFPNPENSNPISSNDINWPNYPVAAGKYID